MKALYVIDPGPAGSIGDLQWVIDAHAAGTLPLLIVQAVVMTPLAAAADIVLPGAAWVEKEATYTNDRGLMQAAARVMAPPGDAHEDWRVIADVATAAGITTSYKDAAAVRAAIAEAMGGDAAFAGIAVADVPEAAGGAGLAQRVEPLRALEVGSHVPGPPPVKGTPPLVRGDLTHEE